MMSVEVSLREFVSKQQRLLELELRSEEEEENKTPGNKDDGRIDGGYVLRSLDVIDTSVGLYGRTVVSFGSAPQSLPELAQSGTDPPSQNKWASRQFLPAHRLTVGDEVQILPKNGKGASRGNDSRNGKKSRRVGGVVSAVDDYTISIALSGGGDNFGNRQQNSGNDTRQKQGKQSDKKEAEDADDDGELFGGPPPYSLVPRSNVEVHHKMTMALEKLERHGVNHPIAGNIIMAAFDLNTNSKQAVGISQTRMETLEKELNLSSTRLDYSQKEAVMLALDSECPISLIHGPPGTGKTTTVAELIRCAVQNRGWRVLVTAPSNVAVDNVLDRLMSLENEISPESAKRKGTKKSTINIRQKIKAVRLGHPARIQHGIQKYSLESLVQASEGTEIVKDCRSELSGHLRTLSNAKAHPSEKRVAYREMKSLRKEIRTREEKVVGEILRESNVVMATNVGAAGSVFNRMIDGKGEPIAFDLVIIDEAAQALEASCWISLLRGKRAVLAGDHKQLSPTIKSSVREVQQELGKTLFERLMNAYASKNNGVTNTCSRMLEVQYRMHEDIANWASNAMYNGKLISHESVRGRKLVGLTQVKENTNSELPENVGSLKDVTLMLIDTTGCDMHEMANDAGSRYNEGEGDIVVSQIRSLISLGLKAEDIAVITPYNGQVELLRKRLLPEIPKLEIRSVDGFQGGEREAVVISLVRSSDRGGKDGIGFLRDERRLNVAVTRAKRHCTLVCDCETVSQSSFIKSLINWMDEKGSYHSGMEFLPEDHQPVVEASRFLPNDTLAADKSKKSLAKITENQKAQKECNLINSTKTTPHKDCDSNNLEVETDESDAESKRTAMMEKINTFATSGKKGEELAFADLSNFDCIVARELAVQLGLGCREDEEDNQGIILYAMKDSKVINYDFPTDKIDTNATKFAELCIDDDSSESSHDEDNTSVQSTNNLLRNLAKERQERQREQNKEPSAKSTTTQASTKKKNSAKKGKGQKLGGSLSIPQKVDNMDDLDDLAFLDAQIDKVQNSHGRKIEASGKGYRSIMNGILLASAPQKEEAKRNSAVSAHLQSKIKSKAQGRQAKTKKK